MAIKKTKQTGRLRRTEVVWSGVQSLSCTYSPLRALHELRWDGHTTTPKPDAVLVEGLAPGPEVGAAAQVSGTELWSF